MFEWFQTYETIFYWIAGGSLAAFAATLVMIPWLVLRIPADYFTSDKLQMKYPDSHRSTGIWLLVRIMKNAAGLVFVTAGIVMLFTPGQGLLTIIIGLGLMNFPGKFRLERWMISRGSTLKIINRYRLSRGKPPLLL